jgi:H+/Cl- antiporter ClcA
VTSAAQSLVRRRWLQAQTLARWIVLGALAGLLAGVSSWCFLRGLDRVIHFRQDGRQWLVYLLPLAGLAMGVMYHYLGGRSSRGSNLLLDEIHEPTAWVPRRMAVFVLLGTWVSHLFGASVGREGTALQMSGALSDGLIGRGLRLSPRDRRLLLISALAGGFGAVFGTPVAGAVFALEVQAAGRLDLDAIVPAITASVVGDRLVAVIGYHHERIAALDLSLSMWQLGRVAIAGVAFGLCAVGYVALTHAVQRGLARRVSWPPLRPVIGGVATIALVLMVGHDYQSLSLPLVNRALAGDELGIWVFALKLVFTAVALGSGLLGGEVTPLFVMGATLGSALAGPLDLPVALVAAIGFCAVFAGAAKTPIACMVLGVELFGGGAVLPVAIGCAVSYSVSGSRSIYVAQRP